MKVHGMEDVEVGDAFPDIELGLGDGTFQIQFDCGCLAIAGEGLVTACMQHDEEGHRSLGSGYAAWRREERRYTWLRRVAWALTLGLMFSVPLIAYMVLSI